MHAVDEAREHEEQAARDREGVSMWRSGIDRHVAMCAPSDSEEPAASLSPWLTGALTDVGKIEYGPNGEGQAPDDVPSLDQHLLEVTAHSESLSHVGTSYQQDDHAAVDEQPTPSVTKLRVVVSRQKPY
jgi:hypothetical protein